MFLCRLHHLPLAIVVIMSVTGCVTFYLAYFEYKHVTYILPYISDTGTLPPESCIFGESLNIVALLIAIVAYVKYLQVQEIYEKHRIEENYHLNKVCFILAILASIGLTLVANFQETNVFSVHWTGAILIFGAGSIYECLLCPIYIKLTPVIGQRKTTIIRIILASLALITFVIYTITGLVAYAQFKGDDVLKWKKEEGGFVLHQISTILEWVCGTAFTLFIALFYKEFRNTSVKTIVTFEKTEEIPND